MGALLPAFIASRATPAPSAQALDGHCTATAQQLRRPGGPGARKDGLASRAVLVLGVVLGVGTRMHKKAAAVEEADMMIGGDASGIVVGGSVAVETWKIQAAPRSPAWL